MMQTTLRDTLHFEGIGLHTGQQASVDVRPSGPDSGLTFVLGETRVPAVAENVVDTSRATVLGREGASVSTTEHLLSALFAMGVCNAEIHVDGPEIPACDGSSAVFTEAIAGCGLQSQEGSRGHARRRTARLPALGRPDDRRLSRAELSSSLRCGFCASDRYAVLRRRDRAGAIRSGDRRRPHVRLSARRSKRCWERGLGRGGSLENALVFTPDGPMQAVALAQRSGSP